MFDPTDPAGPSPHQPPSSGRSAVADDPTVPVGVDGAPSDAARGRRRGAATGWAITIAVAVALTVVIRSFVLTAYSIPSESMVPTLDVNDRVLVFRLNTDPARGDVVVFDRPPNDPKTSPDDPDVLIKRVIGLPGETVTSQDGKVYVDGKRLVEDYLPDGTNTTISTAITVPTGKLLVLGDNRTASFDGRFFGPIDKDLVVGRAIARIWPFSRIGGL